MSIVDTTDQSEIHGQGSGRFDGSTGPRIIGPRDGKAVDLGSLGVRFMAWAAETGGGFALVEHPIPPRTLVAPLHRHQREDEYSFILKGRMGAQLGDDVVVAETGDFAFKPRQQWHTFWNAGDTPCRILEIISPGGFEKYFDEFHDLMKKMGTTSQAKALVGSDLLARYQLDIKPESIPELCQRHGLVFPA